MLHIFLIVFLTHPVACRKENEKLMQAFQEHAEQGMRSYNEADYAHALQCKISSATALYTYLHTHTDTLTHIHTHNTHTTTHFGF